MNKKKVRKVQQKKKVKRIKKRRSKVVVRSKKLTLIPAPINQKQLMHIIQGTPAAHIYKRPAKGGGEWEYVTGTYIKKVLNYTFGWMWDFEIKEHGKEGELIWVLGRLTIKNKKGQQMIVKEQFGRADIKFKKGTKIPLDFGNDLKAASTDALKKCASELGIASDVYGKEEFKQIQKMDKGFVPPQEDGPKVKREIEIIQVGVSPKIEELKELLHGESDGAKIKDLKRKTGIAIENFQITERHAILLIAQILNKTVKHGKK